VLSTTKHQDQGENYKKAIKGLWNQFKSSVETRRNDAIQEMLQRAPTSEVPEDQRMYMEMMKDSYFSMIDQRMSKEEAGRRVIEQITRTINQTTVWEVLMQNGISQEKQWTWYLEGDIEDNLWGYCRSIYAVILGVDITREDSPYRIKKAHFISTWEENFATSGVNPSSDTGHIQTQQDGAFTRMDYQQDAEDIYGMPYEKPMQVKIEGTNCCEIHTHPAFNQDPRSTPVRPVMDGASCDRGTQHQQQEDLHRMTEKMTVVIN
jgi:hypothetical protein